jgi:hypothetical protein
MVEPVGTDEQRGDMFTKNLRVAKYESNRKLTSGWKPNNQPLVQILKLFSSDRVRTILRLKGRIKISDM